MCNRTSVAKALSITTSHLKFVANGGMPAEIVALRVYFSVTSTYRGIPTYSHMHKNTHTHTHTHTLSNIATNYTGTHTCIRACICACILTRSRSNTCSDKRPETQGQVEHGEVDRPTPPCTPHMVLPLIFAYSSHTLRTHTPTTECKMLFYT